MRRSAVAAILIIMLMTFSGCFEKLYETTIFGYIYEFGTSNGIPYADVMFTIEGKSSSFQTAANASGYYTKLVTGLKKGDIINYSVSKSGYITENGILSYAGELSINADIYVDPLIPEDISISGYATLMNLTPPAGSISSISRIAPVKQAVAPEPTQVIISPKVSAKMDRIEGFVLEKGTQIREVHFDMNVILVDVPKGTDIDDFIRQIEAEGWANYVEPNSYALPTATKFIPNDTAFSGYQWNMYATSMPYVWGMGSFGSGVTVAVIDSGVDVSHPDLAGRLLPPIDTVYTSSSPNYCVDLLGHGTHVAGIIGAIVNNSSYIAGMNNLSVFIQPIKAYTDGSGFAAKDLAEAIDAAISVGADIINMSLGWSDGAYDSTVAAAVQRAYNAGIAVVAAAGNGASSVVDFPANLSNVIAVSAVDSTLSISNFSDYGTEVDFAAPGGSTVGGGEFIYSTYPIALGGIGGLAGTSQASPHVAALIAMLMTRGATRNEALDTMRYTAQLDDMNPSYYGSGLINAYAAVNDFSMDNAIIWLTNTANTEVVYNIGLAALDRSFNSVLPDAVTSGTYNLWGWMDCDSSASISYGDYLGYMAVTLSPGMNALDEVLKMNLYEDPAAPTSKSIFVPKNLPVPKL